MRVWLANEDCWVVVQRDPFGACVSKARVFTIGPTIRVLVEWDGSVGEYLPRFVFRTERRAMIEANKYELKSWNQRFDQAAKMIAVHKLRLEQLRRRK